MELGELEFFEGVGHIGRAVQGVGDVVVWDFVACLTYVQHSVFSAGLQFETHNRRVVTELVFMELVFGGFIRVNILGWLELIIILGSNFMFSLIIILH